MKQLDEMVLIYNFQSEDKVNKVKEILEDLKIKSYVATPKDLNQSIGFLLNLKGFSKKEEMDVEFNFPYEFMMFKDFTQNRYLKVVNLMKDLDLTIPECKAVLTPTNRFWSLKKICENMAKEHLENKKA